MANPYTTKELVKEYIGKTTTTDDAFIEKLIAQVTPQIDKETGTTFGVDADTTVKFDAVRDVLDQDLLFSEWLAAVTTVTNGDGEVITSANYVLLGDGPFYGIRIFGGKVWNFDDYPENAIEIVGKWGYSETIPKDLEQVCTRLTSYYLNTRREKIDALPVWVNERIDLYRMRMHSP